MTSQTNTGIHPPTKEDTYVTLIGSRFVGISLFRYLGFYFTNVTAFHNSYINMFSSFLHCDCMVRIDSLCLLKVNNNDNIDGKVAKAIERTNIIEFLLLKQWFPWQFH